VAGGAVPVRVEALRAAIEEDGGAVIGVFRDPLGGKWQVLASLPIDKVKPTPYQRDVSDAHVQRLSHRIDQIDRFLDPVIVYRVGDGEYWTPNGGHRTTAMQHLGARSITALVIPDEDIAYKILALNTEKAHNVREKSLEVIRMARALAELDPQPERAFAVEFEEPAFLTLGICYENRGRFSGGAYQPVLKRVEKFLGSAMPMALAVREGRAARLLELDDVVVAAVRALKEQGIESPYLKAFVIARINPLRFKRGGSATFDEALDKMLASAKRFNPSRIKSEHIARASGPPAE